MIPIEWLRSLRELNGYDRLLVEAGCLAHAAWRLAKVKCQVWETPTAVPNSRELRAAAREIVDRTAAALTLPSGRQLAQECEAAGFLVI